MRRAPILSTTLILSLFSSAQAAGQSTSALPSRSRIIQPIDDNRSVTLVGNVHPFVLSSSSNTVDESTPMEHIVLLLKGSPSQENDLAQLIAQQSQPKSSQYHKFLTPQEFASRFGVAKEDLSKINAWLSSHGFHVDEYPAGQRAIVFSGTAGQIAEAFKSEIRRFTRGASTHLANATDPQIPAALAGVVGGVVKLHNVEYQHGAMKPVPLSASQIAHPNLTSGATHYLAPADYATIYNINLLYGAGVNGAGQTIAIIARSNIAIADVQSFRTTFGLPANNPQIVVTNTDPGVIGGDSTETTLDTEWSGAVAPNATVKVIVAASTNTTDGIDLSALYAVNNNVAPILSLSYGACEAAMGKSEVAFYNSLWQQAAAQGITVLVSSGDSGVAGCSGGSASSASPSSKGINGLCSSPYATCVGGTQFAEGTNPGQYWQPGNNPVYGSATGYIPEAVWNESASNGGSGLWSGGGGASISFAKPSWQNGPGVPSDGFRDVPDVSLSAAEHDGYLIAQNGNFWIIGGTSASAPSFAGLMALVNQKTNSRQGLANTTLYPLATKQSTGGAAVFHDITSGNNSVPGLSGFSAASGYDLASGLGSVDAQALVNHWNDIAAVPPSITLAASTVSLRATTGQTVQNSITSTASVTLNSAVTLSISGAPTGVTATLASTTIMSPGSGSVALSIAVSANAVPGTYPLTVTAKAGSVTQTLALTLTVVAPTCTLATSAGSVAVAAGQTADIQVSCIAVQGVFGTSISLALSGLPSGVTAKFTPSTLVPGSSSGLNLATTATVTPGQYRLFLTATAANFSQTLPIVLLLSARSTFSLASQASTLTIKPGSSGQMSITSTHSGSFNSAIALSFTGLPSGVTASLSKSSIPAPGDGSVAATFAAALTAKPGSYAATLTGTGGGVTQTIPVTITVAASPDFSFALNLSNLLIQQGGVAGTVVISTGNFTGGFNSTITIKLSGLAAGMNYGVTGATAGGNLVNTSIGITASTSSAAGVYPVTFTASGAGITHSATIQVTVVKAASQTRH